MTEGNMGNNIVLTDEQKKMLNIIEDKRVDFYFRVENAVIDNYQIFDSIYEAYLYVVLCRYCNNGSVAFPGYKKLADQCHCSRRTIINAMNVLEKKGYINKVTRSYVKEGKKINETNLYTINNIMKYVKIDTSVSDALPLVQDMHHPNASDALNKELEIKNNNINNTTTSSSVDRYDFLDLEEFNLLNKGTKNNIRKNINNLDLEKFKKVYDFIKKKLDNGKVKNFNAFLYELLNKKWDINIQSEEIIERELDNEKKKWLNYYSGIMSNQALKEEVEKIIIDIPLEILNKNKSKLGMMNGFEFKQHLYTLKK